MTDAAQQKASAAREAQVDATPQPAKPFLTGPRRTAAIILMISLIVGSWVRVVIVTRPPAVIDATVHVRATGSPVPVFAEPRGDETIHWLTPASTIQVTQIERGKGSRYPVLIKLEDGINVEGYVNMTDLVAEDLDRVRRDVGAQASK